MNDHIECKIEVIFITSMYESRNHLMICAKYADPELHRHSAAHIMISLNDSIEVMIENEKIKCKGVLIPSGIYHTANTQGNGVLVFLFDNTTAVSNQIDQVRVISDDDVCKIQKSFRDFESSIKNADYYETFIQCIFSCIGINAFGTAITDERVQSSLRYIQSRLNETITCAEAAKNVFLSESRYSHLFREQVGMTFASYVIYQRIMKTYTDIINGKTITNAALDAGFSSSAHFAEVNKRLFGISATGVKNDLQFYKIAEI